MKNTLCLLYLALLSVLCSCSDGHASYKEGDAQAAAAAALADRVLPSSRSHFFSRPPLPPTERTISAFIPKMANSTSAATIRTLWL